MTRYLIFLFFPVVSFAQTNRLSIGIDAGTNFSSLLGSQAVSKSTFVGNSIGLKARYALGGSVFVPKALLGGGKALDRLSFETGIKYVYNGYGYSSKNQEHYIGINQIEIPFFLVTKFTQWLPQRMIKERTTFVEWLGPVVSFQKGYTTSNVIKNGDEIINDKIKISPVNLFFSAGVGMERHLKGIGFRRRFVDMIVGTAISIHMGYINVGTGDFTSSKTGNIGGYEYMGSYLSADIYVIPLYRAKLTKGETAQMNK